MGGAVSVCGGAADLTGNFSAPGLLRLVSQLLLGGCQDAALPNLLSGRDANPC